ncbi:MAG: selenium metabolism-associated LysR family transcriptional regulator [Bacteroidota bacterium]
MLNEFKLLVFHKVATEGSFSKAAEDLFVSQPAVTKQINSLEDELGIKLFERNNKGIVLTAAGKLFLEHAGVILSQFKRLKNDMSLLSEQVSGELTIGASTTIAQYVLPPVLAQFRQANPSLKLTLLNENSETVENLLQRHEINLGIIEGLPKNNALQYTLFIKDELVLITHKASIYYRLEACSLNDLRKSDLVLREKGSGTLEVFEDFIGQYGLSLNDMNTLIQLGSTESIKLFLKHADAIGVVSIQAMKEEITRGEFRVIELEEGRIFRNFYFVHEKGTPEKLVSSFVSFLKNRYNAQV